MLLHSPITCQHSGLFQNPTIPSVGISLCDVVCCWERNVLKYEVASISTILTWQSASTSSWHMLVFWIILAINKLTAIERSMQEIWSMMFWGGYLLHDKVFLHVPVTCWHSRLFTIQLLVLWNLAAIEKYMYEVWYSEGVITKCFIMSMSHAGILQNPDIINWQY